MACCCLLLFVVVCCCLLLFVVVCCCRGVQLRRCAICLFACVQDQKDDSGETCLMKAAQAAQEGSIRFLAERKVNWLAAGPSGDSAACMAARANQWAVLEFMIMQVSTLHCVRFFGS